MHLVSEQHHSNTTYSLSSLIINEGDTVQSKDRAADQRTRTQT